jgi:hypothetical protein
MSELAEGRIEVQLPEGGLERELKLLDELAIPVGKSFRPALQRTPFGCESWLQQHSKERVLAFRGDDGGEEVNAHGA